MACHISEEKLNGVKRAVVLLFLFCCYFSFLTDYLFVMDKRNIANTLFVNVSCESHMINANGLFA